MASATGVLNLMGADESRMIRTIVDGRPDLFDELISPHLASLSRTVCAALGGHGDTQDVVQETLIKAFTHLNQYRFEASFRTWLLRIGINEVRQWRRKASSSRTVALDPPVLAQLPVSDQRHSPMAEYQRRETHRSLRAAITALPEKYRIVILLCDVHGLPQAEVARKLGLKLATLKTRHLRARHKVALRLREAQTRPRTPK